METIAIASLIILPILIVVIVSVALKHADFTSPYDAISLYYKGLQMENEKVKTLQEEKVLEDGSVVLSLEFTKKEADTIFRAAMISNTLTLYDLEYQYEQLKTKSFKKLVIAASVLQSLKEFIEEETPKCE